jgi:hypothetical protein
MLEVVAAVWCLVWFGVWLARGAHFWLLPNMMSEEVRLARLLIKNS